jgi:hypothetical protein
MVHAFSDHPIGVIVRTVLSILAAIAVIATLLENAKKIFGWSSQPPIASTALSLPRTPAPIPALKQQDLDVIPLQSASIIPVKKPDRPAIRQYTLENRVKYQLWNYTWKPDPGKPVTRVEVRLGEQKVYVYQGDIVAAESPASTGMTGHETPLGHYSIIEKDIDHKSKFDVFSHDVKGDTMGGLVKAGQKPPVGTVFEAVPMPYYLRIHEDAVNEDGMGLNAGYLPGNPSTDDGGIRLPHAFAELLFANISVGTPVDIVP